VIKNNIVGGFSYLRPIIYAKGIGKAGINSFKWAAERFQIN